MYNDDGLTERRWLTIWCASAFALPFALLVFFETTTVPANSRTNVPAIAHRANAYLTLHHASVVGQELDHTFNVTSVAACAQLCDAAGPRCAAFDFDSNHCVRRATARSVRRAGLGSASLRRGHSWPVRAASRVKWQHNATLVLAWSGGDLGWLRRLPAHALDVAVIAISSPDAHNKSMHRARANQPTPQELLRFGLKTLKYYSALPLNPSRTAAGSSSSAAATALAGLSFITTFYHNLPPLIILADERCGQDADRRPGDAAARAPREDGPMGCAWLSALGKSTTSARKAISRAVEIGSRGDEAPSEAGCLCHLAPASGGAMAGSTALAGIQPRQRSWFDAQFLGRSGPSSAPSRRRMRGARDVRSAALRMPLDGPLALTSTRLRSRPAAAYSALLQLLLVDSKYPGTAGHTWAVLLGRLWLDFVHAGADDSALRAAPRGGSTFALAESLRESGPSDPCFDLGGACGEHDGRGGRLRARLRRAQLRATRAIGGAREAVVSGMSSVRSTMPQLELPPRVRTWWRTVNGGVQD